MRPFLRRERLEDLHIFKNFAEVAIQRLKDRLDKGCSINFHDLTRRFTFDSAGVFFLRRRFNILKKDLPYPRNSSWEESRSKIVDSTAYPSPTEFAEAFENMQDTISRRRAFSDLWPLTELGKNKTRDSMNVIRRYLSPIIDDAVAKSLVQRNAGSDESDEDEVFLEHLVKYTQDPVILTDAILNLLVAARDTTASLITLTVYALARKPEIVTRLRAYILQSIGQLGSPTIEQIKGMKYLRAVLNETLRLYPPIPFNARCSIKATTFPSTTSGGKPFYIPPNTNCFYSVFSMHCQKDLWGPDALEYDPDRFLDERYSKYVLPQPFIFLPFNASPRICLTMGKLLSSGWKLAKNIY